MILEMSVSFFLSSILNEQDHPTNYFLNLPHSMLSTLPRGCYVLF